LRNHALSQIPEGQGDKRFTPDFSGAGVEGTLRLRRDALAILFLSPKLRPVLSLTQQSLLRVSPTPDGSVAQVRHSSLEAPKMLQSFNFFASGMM
jgi:hypothetical protein